VAIRSTDHRSGPVVAERSGTESRATSAVVARRGHRRHRRWPGRRLDKGWYVDPTVFVGVDNKMKIAQEEISVRSWQ